MEHIDPEGSLDLILYQKRNVQSSGLFTPSYGYYPISVLE